MRLLQKYYTLLWGRYGRGTVGRPVQHVHGYGVPSSRRSGLRSGAFPAANHVEISGPLADTQAQTDESQQKYRCLPHHPTPGCRVGAGWVCSPLETPWKDICENEPAANPNLLGRREANLASLLLLLSHYVRSCPHHTTKRCTVWE